VRHTNICWHHTLLCNKFKYYFTKFLEVLNFVRCCAVLCGAPQMNKFFLHDTAQKIYTAENP
jgi:hypothetical protein